MEASNSEIVDFLHELMRRRGGLRADQLPEFRDYAWSKYPDELDEALVLALEELIERRRKRRRL